MRGLWCNYTPEKNVELSALDSIVSNNIVNYKLYVPASLAGRQVVVLINPDLRTFFSTNISPNNISSGGVLTTWQIDANWQGGYITKQVNVSRAHEGYATNPGGLHWSDVIPGSYKLAVAIYPYNPFKPGSDMEYYSVAEAEARGIAKAVVAESDYFSIVQNSNIVPTLNIFANTNSNYPGQPVNINVTVSNAVSCQISGGTNQNTNIPLVGNNGSIVVSPMVTTSYSIGCNNQSGKITWNTLIITVNDNGNNNLQTGNLMFSNVGQYTYPNYNNVTKTVAQNICYGVLLDNTGRNGYCTWNNERITPQSYADGTLTPQLIFPRPNANDRLIKGSQNEIKFLDPSNTTGHLNYRTVLYVFDGSGPYFKAIYMPYTTNITKNSDGSFSTKWDGITINSLAPGIVVNNTLPSDVTSFYFGVINMVNGKWTQTSSTVYLN
jgi:hypothetical protein